MKRDVFMVKVDGVDVELAVQFPTPKQKEQADLVYLAAFHDAILNKALLRSKLEAVARQQGIWNDEMQAESDRLSKQIEENRLKLKAGGIKLSEAKKVALETIRLTNQLINLKSDINKIDNNTVEGTADNRKFDYLVSVCTVYNNDNKPYFKDLEAYNSDTSGVGYEAARRLSALINNYDVNFYSDLPEYKFLTEFKFVDEKYRLIDKDGNLVDESGKRIDEFGRYINDKGEFVDAEGNLVDENFERIVEFKPFLED